MRAGQPEQVGRGQQLKGPKAQHPAGRDDQQDPKAQGQQQAEIQGLALFLRVMQPPGDRRQSDRVVGGEHHLQHHQQGQHPKHLPPLIHALEEA